MSLHPMVGHDGLRASLTRAAEKGTLPAGLFIHGLTGVGKQRLGLWIGQRLLCENPGPKGPCDECRSCRLALRLEHPDLHWYFPLPRPKGSHSPEKLAQLLEEARHARLGEIREHPLRVSHHDEPRGFYLAMAREFRRTALKRPSMGSSQIFILGEAELLIPQASSPEAANALLKLFEEPPRDTYFVLTSNAPGRVIETIRSRTVPIHLPPLTKSEVGRFLHDVAQADEEEAGRSAHLSQGSIGRGLGFLRAEKDEPGPLETLRQNSFQLLRAALDSRSSSGLVAALGFPSFSARGLLDLFAYLEEWVRDLAAAAAGASEAILNQDAADYLVRMVRERGIGPDSATRALEPVKKAQSLAAGNVNPQLIVSGLIEELGVRLGVRTGAPEVG